MSNYDAFLTFMELYDRATSPLVTPEEREGLLKAAAQDMATACQPPKVQDIVDRLVAEALAPPPKQTVEKPVARPRKA